MPLKVYLREPPIYLIAKGNKIDDHHWRKRRLGLFPRRVRFVLNNGGEMLTDSRNVLAVETMTEEQLAEARKRMEEQKQAGASPNIARPTYFIPRKGN